ncbi:unnamed protein product [Meloidogyne enterolobii]|uniref:Uncharacterized protein n=1 Tax=Meloidogyne enterolobii TaxID=390850 RepID=A0ACB1A3Q7_MELEN
MAIDSTNVDLLIIIGSSLQVRPVSLIPYNIDNSIPQILINRELLPNYTADVKLLGDCDKILCLLAMSLKGQICEKMIQGSILKFFEEFRSCLIFLLGSPSVESDFDFPTDNEPIFIR